MAQASVIEEKPLSMAEMKEELARIKKRDNELNFRANKTDEYLAHFAKQGNALKLAAEITKLSIPRLKENHIIKIVDLHPATIEQLKAVLQGYTLSVSDDNLKKIVNVLKS